MVSNMQLGDVYWTENGYGGISDYVKDIEKVILDGNVN